MSLEEKRSLARQLLRGAGKKISYNKQAKGIFIADTEYDPRVSTDKVKRYNNTQLDSLIDRLQRFTSRKNQFAKGYQGAPLPMETVREYRKQVQQYNKQVREHNERWDKIYIPSQHQTVEQRRAMLMPKHRVMDQPADYSPTEVKEIVPERFLSKKGLEMSIHQLRQKQTSKYWEKQRAFGRENYRKMAQMLNSKELDEAAAGLTDEQFAFLWEATNFANEVSLGYVMVQSKQQGKNLSFAGGIAETSIKVAIGLINEAKSLI